MINTKRTLFIAFFLFSFFLFSQKKPIKIEGLTQGTTYHITYYDNKNRDFKPKIEKILQTFDNSVSTYNPNSIISKVNSNVKDVKLDTNFKVCFLKGKEMWRDTDGAFDPTVFPLVNAWGFGPGKKLKVEKQIIDSLLQFVGFDLIDIKSNKIVKKDPRVSLDFNAFAQGYSVDVVASFLNKKGIKSYIVEIGGEVYARGKKPNGANWTVGIEKPLDNKESNNPLKAIVKLENVSLATSGNYRRYFVEDGVKYAHNIDPKTGYSSKNNLLSTSVFYKECIDADALATGLLVMGLDKSIAFLKSHPEYQAILIYSDESGNFQVYETAGIKSIVHVTE